MHSVFVHGRRDAPAVAAVLALLRELGLEEAHRPSAACLAVAPLLRRKLSAEELNAPRLGTLIFHPSLLPRHRGRDAIKWALACGASYTGATWFWADEGLDTGDVCEQEALEIQAGESPRDFYARAVVPSCARLLRYALLDLGRGHVRRRPQRAEAATYERPFPTEPAAQVAAAVALEGLDRLFGGSTTTAPTTAPVPSDGPAPAAQPSAESAPFSYPLAAE